MKKSLLTLVSVMLTSMSALAAGWVEPIPEFTAPVFDGTPQFLYNTGVKGFFCGGNDYNTRASISTTMGDSIYFQPVTDAEGSYYFRCYPSVAKKGNFFFVSANGWDASWVDAPNDGQYHETLDETDAYPGVDKWALAPLGNNIYKIYNTTTLGQIPEFDPIEGVGYYGIAEYFKGEGNNTRTYFYDPSQTYTYEDEHGEEQTGDVFSGTFYDEWRFVSQDAYATWLEKKAIFDAAVALGKALDDAAIECPDLDVSAIQAVFGNPDATEAELKQALEDLTVLMVNYKLKDATVENPADISEKIVNRTFDTVGDFTGWNGDGFGAGGTTSTNAEIYGKSFDTWQDIENLPGGIYMIACKGYTRYQNAQADFDAWKAGKVSETKVYLKSETLGQYFSPVMHVSQDGSIDAPIGTQATTSVQYKDAEEVNHTLYCPNTMASANEYFHENPSTGGDPVHGRYYNEAFGPKADGETLRIGVFNQKATGSDWSIFDDFQLFYFGDGLDAYQYWGSKVAAANVISFDNVYYGIPERQYYESIMKDVTSADTKEAIAAAILNVDLAVDSVSGSMDAYLAYIAMCDEAAAWLSESSRGEALEVLKLSSYLETMAEDNEEATEEFGFPNGVSNYILNRLEGEYAGRLTTKDIIAETAYVKEMYEDAIRHALTPGTDLTGLIVNPGFEEAGGKGWSLDTHNGTCTNSLTNWHGGSSANWCAEAFQQKFDVYQVITGVENGLYEVSVQAFYRTASNQAAYDAYEADPEMTGDAKVYSYVYFNDFAKPVRNVMEIQFEENLANNCWSIPGTDPQKYTLDGMASASAAFSLSDESKNFTMKVYGLVTDGKIRLGIRNTEKNSNASWTLFDNFKLVYKGKDQQALYEVLSNTLEAYTAYIDENGDYITSVESGIAGGAIEVADQALENGEAEVMYDALITLNSAYVGTQTHVATFKAEEEAYDLLNTTLTEYSETASDAAITRAEYLLSDDASGSDLIDNMSTNELQQLVDDMNEAIAALKVPPYDRATPENPVDCSSVIENNGFEAGNLNGWINSGTINAQSQNNDSFDGKVGTYYCERWHVNGTIDIHQTLREMPAGLYKLTANCYSSATDAKLYANSDSVDVTTSMSYEVSFVLDAEIDTISIGVKWSDSGDKWTCLDEFKLLYYGPDATSYEELAAEIKQASEIVAIYSADGVFQKTLQLGLNIVVYANGEVKKIYRKK